jgi:pimeloyl-ACP methyl ester carboxylesterase
VLTLLSEDAVAFPGAQPPARQRWVETQGVRLAVHEWGDATAPPLLLAHGGFDFARTYDVFAPLLAAGGWRVVSWDHRGHGDSAHAHLYSWEADARDLIAVADSITPAALPAIGHSKGGALLIQVAQALPHRFSRVVAIDGLPSRRPPPDVAEHERTRMVAAEVSSWLDHRRNAGSFVRKPGTREELARRRARMNPRLSHEWLFYLAGIGARQDSDGWRWKIDPALRMGGFGPWRSQWAVDRLPGFPAPLLGILGTEHEEMGWGVGPDDLRPYLPVDARLEVIRSVGHFIHIERPRETAQLILEFLRPE